MCRLNVRLTLSPFFREGTSRINHIFHSGILISICLLTSQLSQWDYGVLEPEKWRTDNKLIVIHADLHHHLTNAPNCWHHSSSSIINRTRIKRALYIVSCASISSFVFVFLSATSFSFREESIPDGWRKLVSWNPSKLQVNGQRTYYSQVFILPEKNMNVKTVGDSEV